ncbi:hypothetical protein MRX96_003194 [Rhipicephalus microplus]
MLFDTLCRYGIRKPFEIERCVYEYPDRRLIIARRRRGWLTRQRKETWTMTFLETWLCLLTSVLRCSGQESGGDHSHEVHRFVVSVGQPLIFDEARTSCRPDKYLLNLQAAVNVSHVPAMLQRHGLGSAYVWLNMRRVQGFFHWLDPIPQLFRQHPSWPYGNKIASDSFHYECAVLNTSIGLIETRPCEDKHQFVCIRDNELRPVDVSERELSVELTSSQPPILLSRSLADFRLTCRAKLRNGTMLKEPGNHGYAHVWTKNGIFLDTTNSFLQPETVSELNAYTHIDPSKQGRYQCGLKALPSGHTVWSHVITLVFEDFDTYRLTGHLHANVDPGPIQFAGSSFVFFARAIDKALNRQQPDELAKWSYSGLTTDYMNHISISIFVYYEREELAWLLDGHTNKHNVFNDSTALKDLLVINNITDVLHCKFLKQERFTFDSKGHVGFVESTPPCLTDSNELAPRSCHINFESVPTWGAFDETTCKAGTQSRVFDVTTNTHHLLCSPHYCVPKVVSGTWSEVREMCTNTGGYLTSNGSGSWTDIVKKHGIFQSDSAGHPEVLKTLQWSRFRLPIVLPVGSAELCFTVSSLQSQNQSAADHSTLTTIGIAGASCNDTRKGECAYRHRSFIRDLYPCPRGGWLDFSRKNTCLWLNLSPLNYKRAAESCRASKGRLAVINNSSLSYTLALLLAPNNVQRQFDRFWIGLQRSTSGIYKWETGELLHDFAWHPRTDYRHSAGTLFVDRYFLQRGLSMRFSLEDPSRKLPFICQAPLRTGTPWLRVERRDRGQRVVLTCRVSAEIIPGSLLWYKDGIAVQGDRVRTADGNDTTLVIERTTPENPYLQGYYWCEGINVADFRPAESKKTLVRFQGVKTYACTMPLIGRNPQLYEISSNEALRFASDFRGQFLYTIGDTTLEGYHKELHVVDIVQDTAATDAVRFLVFLVELPWRSELESQDEESHIIQYLRSAAMRNASWLITSPSVLFNEVRIKSTEMCFEETTMLDNGLEQKLTWPVTPIGSVAIPQEACIQGDGQPVVRRCEGDFTTGAHWGGIQGMCKRPVSETTIGLRNLSMKVVTNATIVPTAERLQELTVNSEILGAQDMLYVATTLENIVSAGTIEPQTAKNIASTTSHVLNIDSQALLQSRSGNSTNRILTAIEGGLSSTVHIHRDLQWFCGYGQSGNYRSRSWHRHSPTR